MMGKEIINEQAAQKSKGKRRVGGRMVSGLILILIGSLALMGNFLDLSSASALILPGMGVLFLVWGILARSGGLLIPGGILAGIGAGALLIEGPFVEAESNVQSGIFLLSFAGGWALITLLSVFVSRPVAWWPLIPGGVLALIGLGLIAGGTTLEIISTAGQFWPVLLILFGLYIIFRRR